jgi:2-polyprenyl-3-methyl-5-hydroxy-6-metoxy-1,4-benzoquinol methylase
MTIDYRQHEINQRYDEYLQPINQNTFHVLDSRIKKLDNNWTDKKILDFGCNIGNLYLTAQGKIKPENYVGIDVMKKSIDYATEKFPETNWIHYNRFNNTFNPLGENNLWFGLPFQPDIIVCYGVFTHMAFEDIKFYIDQLKKILKPGGILVFSIWEDTYYYSYLGFLDRVFGIDVGKVKPKCEKSIYLINRSELIIDQEGLEEKHYTWLETFYTREFFINNIAGVKLLRDHTWSAHEVYYLKT